MTAGRRLYERPIGIACGMGGQDTPYQLGQAAQAGFWRDSTSRYCEITEWTQVEPGQQD